MAALPYMQLYVADYLADAAHLSTVEHGAYLLLMFNYWQRGEPFSAKDERTLNKRLATVARMSNEEWAEAKETLSEFFEVSETEWRHKRIDRDLISVTSKTEKAKAAGKASAAKRSANAEQTLNVRSTNAEQTLNHTDTDTDTDTKDIHPNGCTSPDGDLQKPKKKSCPHAEIISVYHETLRSCPQVRDWHPTRQGYLRGRWNEKEDRQSVDWWKRFFEYVSKSDFLMGRTDGRDGKPPFLADLEWMVRPTNFAKIIEGKYHK